ncbi:SDR family oxidoreductase [Gammaproteobacteria bacterium]|nr:SDR family oxidoreductase [Gammaproteobacteria bacterium]MDG2228506.1 SDR family oxidoreductase [Gammaproteobacteria bacterium]
MKKIYMSGVGGMLGLAFYQEFKKNYKLECSDIDINEDWLTHLDFRNFEEYHEKVTKFKPDWLFHIGAHTSLEFCELNENDAYETNTKAVEHAVSISNSLQIPLLYISTAGIFGGEKEFYDESDQPKPLGHYGNSKYLGELYVQKHSKEYIICRAGWMMGGGEAKDKKFIQKIINQIKEGKDVLYIVNDKDGTPTYTHDFARNCMALIESENRGLFNMVCGGMTSRFEVATELLSILKLKNEIKIEEVSSDYFKEEYFATRPECERLVNKHLDKINMNLMRDWKIALRDCIKEYYPEYQNIK